jgi:nucleotide sugar synthetase-like protein
MRVHITSIYNQMGTHVIAQQNVMKVASTLGFVEMPLFCYDVNVDTDEQLSARLDGIVAGLKFGDIVIIQSPSWNILRYDERIVQRIRAYKDVQIIMFVHDVIPLLFQSGEENLRRTIDIYNMSDLIILPSQAMYDVLVEHGLKVKKYLVQKMFDYPVSGSLNKPEFQKKMIFTGAPSRFTFIDDWKYDTLLSLYTREELDVTGKNIQLNGYQSELGLLSQMSQGGFGLVWSSEKAKEYYYCVMPYKLGNFLAAGIPVIVERGIAPAKAIEKNHLGFVVDCLEEASQRVQSCTPQQYNEMVENIFHFNFLIKDGYFTKKLLLDAIFALRFEE